MSYLELSTGLADFDKAVISLWFRVPDETLQAVLDQPGFADSPGGSDDGYGIYRPPLFKIIPLLTFGSVESAFGYQYDGDPDPLYPISPSFIGIDCNDGVATLAVNLQMSNSTTFSSEPQFIDDQLRPDAFYMSGYGPPPYPGLGELQKLEVTPDQWHHALISFDLSLGCSCYTVSVEEASTLPSFQITPGPTFTWSFDDEDKVGFSMAPSGGAMWVSAPGSSNPMATIPDDSIVPSYLVGLEAGVTPDGNTATWGSVPLEMANSIALPTAAQFVDSIYPVELAELQFFSGVTTDARIESNRRAFVAAEGTPVPPVPPMVDNPDYNPALPVSPSNPIQIPDPDGSPAEKLLGQQPDILFHGSSNWISGKNTGRMVDNPDYDPGQPISTDNPVLIPDPDFQFTPTGKIVSYTPDPSLYGPQSLGPPPAVRLQRHNRVAA